jgi:hypothetical protein
MAIPPRRSKIVQHPGKDENTEGVIYRHSRESSQVDHDSCEWHLYEGLATA